MGFGLVPVSFAQRLPFRLVLFDDIVVDKMKTDVPVETNAERAGQVLGQESACSSQAGDGDQSVVTMGSFSRRGCKDRTDLSSRVR